MSNVVNIEYNSLDEFLAELVSESKNKNHISNCIKKFKISKCIHEDITLDFVFVLLLLSEYSDYYIDDSNVSDEQDDINVVDFVEPNLKNEKGYELNDVDSNNLEMSDLVNNTVDAIKSVVEVVESTNIHNIFFLVNRFSTYCGRPYESKRI